MADSTIPAGWLQKWIAVRFLRDREGKKDAYVLAEGQVEAKKQKGIQVPVLHKGKSS